jgi:GT2 family glycosyltransferase
MSRKQKHTKSAPAVIDVVITTSGRFDMLTKCLNALKREAETTPLNIYVIDNASPAEERISNEALFQGISSKRLTQEVGFPQANNEGARMGSAPLILFLNDDAELHSGAIPEIVKTFNDETVGVVSIKLIFPPDSAPNRAAGKIQHVGMGMTMRGDIDHPLLGWSPEHPKANVSRDVICVTGACLAVRRHLFNKVQGFGLEYGLGTWEDVDLCFKIRGMGFRVYVNTHATGYHYAGATQEKKRRGYPLQQNRLIFQSKWQSTGLMSWTSWEFY